MILIYCKCILSHVHRCRPSARPPSDLQPIRIRCTDIITILDGQSHVLLYIII